MRFDHLINRLFHSESITSPLYNQFISNSKILHALGLLHEHQRPDRDCYIDVDMVAARKYGFDNQLKKASFLKNQKLRNRGFFFRNSEKFLCLSDSESPESNQSTGKIFSKIRIFNYSKIDFYI